MTRKEPRLRGVSSALLIATACALLIPHGAVAQQATATLPQWVVGCWAGTRGVERFYERWVAADAATLIGFAYTVKDGTLSNWELSRIVARGVQLIYIAQPSGAQPTEFTALPGDQTVNAVTFSNPAHDFPKRVGYRSSGSGALTAWIDGGDSGAAGSTRTRIEYVFARSSCEP